MILLLFGEKQRGVPKIVNGVFVSDWLIMPYDRILIGVLAVVFIAAFVLLCSTQNPVARCALARTAWPRS